MNKTEFINRVIDVPWADRACSFSACDCWGLVVLYYRHVLNTELHNLPGYEAGSDFLTCYGDEVRFWLPSEIPQESSVFVGYTGARAAHIGLIIDGGALHSRGDGGGVRFDRLRAVERVFTKLEFLHYAIN